ncbi:MAG: hypothetical protein ACREJU_17210, partial [Nitrospiraceae bacterium]
YAGRGNRDHAITLAKEALDLAQAEGRMDLIPEAKATFLELQPHAEPVVSPFAAHTPAPGSAP